MGNLIINIFAFIGGFTIAYLVSKKLTNMYFNRPRNKEKDWKKSYQYENKEYFMEHYKWCEYGKHYFDAKEDYDCICYAR